MFGIVSYLAIILLGSGMGLPMGIPPRPADPMMAKVAPDDCVFYASWSGIAKTDPNANPTEKWLAQPKTSAALSKLRKAYRGYVLSRETQDPTQKLVNELLIQIIDVGSVEPAAVFIDNLRVTDGKVRFGGGVLVGLGDHELQVRNQFDHLFTFLKLRSENEKNPGLKVAQAIGGDGKRFIKIATPVDNLPILMTLKDGYVMLGVGDGSLGGMEANLATPEPQWLADMKNRLAVDRVASVGFVNVEDVGDLLGRVQWDAWVGSTLKDLLGDTSRVGWVAGLDARGFLSRTEIITSENSLGLFGVVDLKPFPKRFLHDMPADSTIGVASRISTEEVLRLVKATARSAGQEESLDESLSEFQKLTGVSLEEELLASVGDFVSLYYRLDINRWDSGAVVSVRIDDEMSFPAIFKRINRGLKAWVEETDNTEFHTEMDGLNTIYAIKTGRMGTGFAWTLVDDQWLFARNADDLKTHLKGQPDENQYSNQAYVNEVFEFGDQHGLGGPLMLMHLNMVDVFEALRPFENFIEKDEQIGEQFDFKLSDIPPIDEWVNGVQPNVLAMYRTETGFQLFQRQTYPAGSPPVTLAAVAIGALPLQLAEVADRNKLKVIGKAHLDFEKKHKHLCAAYSTDADGNELLSWRVHLLPFLGHQALYSKFRLDEPWDSTTNMLLLEEMPDVYRHATLKLDPSKTVFMVPTSPGSAFGKPSAPAARPPLGMKLVNASDAKSSTLLAVELNRPTQTFWTKPGDTTSVGGEFQQETRGIRDSRQFYMVMLDGSVQAMMEWTARQTLDDIINVNDGHDVILPQQWFWR